MSELDRDLIREFSSRYIARMANRERHLLDEVGPAVAVRGFYTKDELLEVGRWKANRAIGRLGRNDEEEVQYVTRVALAAPLPLRHRLLSVLHGVQRPMASALLTVWRPGEHTVIDVNALNALVHFGRITDEQRSSLTYVEYLGVCRGIVDEVGDVTLRDVDRALWKWWDANKNSVE